LLSEIVTAVPDAAQLPKLRLLVSPVRAKVPHDTEAEE